MTTDTYEKARELFEAAYNEVITSGISKEAATAELAKIMDRFHGGHGFAKRVRDDEAPILNGRATAYRELGAES
jgi:hypothetical protein